MTKSTSFAGSLAPADWPRLARCSGPVLASAALIALLAACASSTPPPGADLAGAPGSGAAKVSSGPAGRDAGSAGSAPAPAASTASRSPRGGAYYLDDGPGHHPMPPIETLVDATPRDEPLHRWANRPYQVFGRDYVPLTERGDFRERGTASWYGRKFHGRPTSTGEPYDMYAMTAAHPTLPLPSYVRVTNLENGRSVVVRVNDRGPFLRGRVIDLSAAAAHRLGYMDAGSAPVEVEMIATAVTPAAQPAARTATTATPVAASAASAVASAMTDVTKADGSVKPQLPTIAVTARPIAAIASPVSTGQLAVASGGVASAGATANAATPAMQPASTPPTPTPVIVTRSVAASSVSAQGELIQPLANQAAVNQGQPVANQAVLAQPVTIPPGVVHAEPVRLAPAHSLPAQHGGVFVQLAAFQSRAAADQASARLRADLGGLNAPLRVVEAAAVYRVQAGPYGDREAADAAALQIRQATGLRLWIVAQP